MGLGKSIILLIIVGMGSVVATATSGPDAPLKVSERNGLPDPWWKSMGSIRRFMPGQDKTTAKEIIGQLDGLKERGYNVIEITAPYRSAGFYPWWGLRPLDYYSVNQDLATDLKGFGQLVEECHRRGLACIAFINLGYDDITSPSWKKAQLEVKQGQDTETTARYRFSSSDTASPGNPSNPFFAQAGTRYQKAKWVSDPLSGKFYWSAWQVPGCAEPEYDWSGSTWPAEARRITTFWMETGLDGIILDAPAWYLNCTFALLKESVIDPIHAIPNAMVVMEGAGGLKENYVDWITQGGFDVCDDQYFESDLSWNGSRVYQAIASGHPDELESDLASHHDQILAAGGILWNYPGWGKGWTIPARTLDVAVLVGTGRLVDLWPEYSQGWSEAERTKLENILRAASTHLGLAPGGSRQRLRTNDDHRFYAFLKRFEGRCVLCAYNFQATAEDITIELGAADLLIPQTAVDCLSQENGPIITSPSFNLRLGPLGFAFYDVTPGPATPLVR